MDGQIGTMTVMDEQMKQKLTWIDKQIERTETDRQKERTETEIDLNSD